MTEARKGDTLSQEARRAVARAGGMVTLTDMAGRWGLHRSRLHQLAERDASFPAPMYEGRKIKLYLADELQDWHEARRRAA